MFERFFRKSSTVVLMIGILFTGGSGWASELGIIDLFSKSPEFMRVLRSRSPLSMVGPNGAVGKNQRQYQHSALQRDVIWLIMRGLAQNDPDPINAGIKALEYGFSKQTPKGNFANGVGASDIKAVGADAFFLQGYCRIQYLVNQSAFANQFSARFDV